MLSLVWRLPILCMRFPQIYTFWLLRLISNHGNWIVMSFEKTNFYRYTRFFHSTKSECLYSTKLLSLCSEELCRKILGNIIKGKARKKTWSWRIWFFLSAIFPSLSSKFRMELLMSLIAINCYSGNRCSPLHVHFGCFLFSCCFIVIHRNEKFLFFFCSFFHFHL